MLDAPLDMRMDDDAGRDGLETAGTGRRKRNYTVVRDYGEETVCFPDCKEDCGCSERAASATTGELASLVRETVRTRRSPARTRRRAPSSFTDSYQSRTRATVALALPASEDVLGPEGGWW